MHTYLCFPPNHHLDSRYLHGFSSDPPCAVQATCRYPTVAIVDHRRRQMWVSARHSKLAPLTSGQDIQLFQSRDPTNWRETHGDFVRFFMLRHSLIKTAQAKGKYENKILLVTYVKPVNPPTGPVAEPESTWLPKTLC